MRSSAFGMIGRATKTRRGPICGVTHRVGRMNYRRGLIVPEGVSHYGLAEHRERLA